MTTLSNDEDLGDITSATGIYFDLLLQLLLMTNILKSRVNFVVNWYNVSFTKLTELAHIATAMGLFKIEATTCKYIVQALCFQYMLVTLCTKSPYLLSHIGLKLLVGIEKSCMLDLCKTILAKLY